MVNTPPSCGIGDSGLRGSVCSVVVNAGGADAHGVGCRGAQPLAFRQHKAAPDPASTAASSDVRTQKDELVCACS